MTLAPNGWLYAAGYTSAFGPSDFALAQYRPDGTLAECQSGQICNHWPTGKRFVNMGGSDSAYALLLRGDNQLVVAGCSDQHMAAAQVSTSDVNAQPLLFQTDFVGQPDCAFGVQFSNPSKNKIVLAGQQAYGSDLNIALARFETTLDTTKLDQTISFAPPPDRQTTDPAFALSASATSGLPVSFSSTSSVCSVSGTTVTLGAQSGICTITASQAGDATYNPAPDVSRSFLVRDPAKQEQIISIEPDPLPAQQPRGRALTLRATASSGMPVEIASITPATCAVSGTTLVGQVAGTCRISVSQAGDAQWNPVRLELTFTITAPSAPSEQIWLPLVRS